jgi:hypothetical protein
MKKKDAIKHLLKGIGLMSNLIFSISNPKLTNIHNKIKRHHHSISLFPFPPALIITPIHNIYSGSSPLFWRGVGGEVSFHRSKIKWQFQ